MNGAEALLKTLGDLGVEACFSNPGTSEMQMVSAFDREPRVRPVLCLFEGGATGAADGYARMAGKPASTLLHLGAGLANGSANLHNAKRAHSPIVNIVGEHATYHRQYDAPLTSDIEGIARPNSQWVRVAGTPDSVPELAAEAWEACQSGAGGVATLILPADSAWSPTEVIGKVRPAPVRPAPSSQAIEAAAKALRAAKKPVLLLGSNALCEQGVAAAGRLALVGVRVLIDTFVRRHPRGAGRYGPDRMMYFGEMAIKDLEGVDLMVLASTKVPVAFFAYPDMPSVLAPQGCTPLTLATPEEDGGAALVALADLMSAPAQPVAALLDQPSAAPSGAISAYTVGDSLCRHMPDHAIISEDAVSSGLPVFLQTRSARPHDWLCLTGGAIGQGIPAAIGAAVACPDRKVLSLNGDGAAAYTLQGLWTMARENLDVTTIIFANRAYRILNIELARTRSGQAGPKARGLLDLGSPQMDWVQLARGFGVEAVRCDDAESFDKALAVAMREKGPRLIEAVIG
jgi:acetolactate synthase-1/2/3 large subunit